MRRDGLRADDGRPKPRIFGARPQKRCAPAITIKNDVNCASIHPIIGLDAVRSFAYASHAPMAAESNQEDGVLVDHRSYRIKPGKIPAFVELYEKYGLEPQARHLGPPLAFLLPESGDINTVVHIWVYEDAADRAARRARLAADPEWKDYLRRTAEAQNIVQQHTSLMIPAKFAPIER